MKAYFVMLVTILLLLISLPGSDAFGATIRVPGDYKFLKDAIDNAAAGDVILLAGIRFSSGVRRLSLDWISWADGYKTRDINRLLIEKSINLQGAGVTKTSVVGGTNSSIIISSDSGAEIVIKDMTIGGAGNVPRIIVQGNVKVVFENVRFGNAVLNLLGKANVHMYSCEVEKLNTSESFVEMEEQSILHVDNCTASTEGGFIDLADNSKLYIEESELVGGIGSAAGWGTLVSIQGGAAEIRDSHVKCEDDYSSVIRVSGNGTAIVDNCSVEGTGYGLEISEGSLMMIKSIVSGKAKTAVDVGEEGVVSVDHCRIEDSKIGISVSQYCSQLKAPPANEQRADVVVTGSMVLGNSVGIVAKGGEISVERSEVNGNVEAGIVLEGIARALVTDSRITNNEGWGILARDDGVAVGWGNTITGNQRDLTGVSDWLTKPEIEAERGIVRVPSEASTIEEAVYRVSQGGNIIIESGDYSEERVLIYKKVNLNGQGGEVVIGGITVFNELGNIRVSGVDILPGKGEEGIVISRGNQLEISDCVVSDWWNGIHLLPGSGAIVLNSSIRGNRTGIEDYSSGLLVKGCNISLNISEAIWSASEDLRIENCTIGENGEDSNDFAVCCSGKNARIKESVIENNTNGVEVNRRSTCNIEDCSILGNAGVGSSSDGTLTISGSRIMNNGSAGVYATRGTLKITSTEVASNKYGVFLDEAGKEMDKLIGDGTCIRNNSSANLEPAVDQYPWPPGFEACEYFSDVEPPALVEDLAIERTDGEGVALMLRWTNPSDSDLAQVRVCRKQDAWPRDHLQGEIVYEEVAPKAAASIEYIDRVQHAGNFHYAIFSADTNRNWNNRVEQGNNAASIAIPQPAEDNHPVCSLQLLDETTGLLATQASIGARFVIYVGDSTDDTDIKEVRFSSDDNQDSNPSGEWTDWYAWDTSSGDWDAETKTMGWTFTTIGEKEVWAEVKDEAEQTNHCYADIDANPRKDTSTKFRVGDYVRVNRATSMRGEPITKSEALHVLGKKTAGEILENESNGLFLDGYHWWYLKVPDGIFSYTGWCREKDLEKNASPNASFAYSPAVFKCGQDVTLDASKSKDTDGKITAYRWDLDGNGKVDGWTTSPEIIYYWDEPGDRNVTLEVEDDSRGTSRITKTITVDKRSIWEELKGIFISLPKFSGEWLKEIKRELRIKNWSQEIPIYDPDPLSALYNYSDDDLATVLSQEIDQDNNPGVTYGAYILDSIREKRLIEMAASSAWQNEKAINAYFNDLVEINIWAEEGQLLSEEALVDLIGLSTGSNVGISTLLYIPKLCEAGIGLKALDTTLFRKALWKYFSLRMIDYGPNDAFDAAEVPSHYSKDETREYFESLWNTYLEFGSQGDFVAAWRADLQDFLQASLEKYKFYTQIVMLKSAGELRVYDSEGRVTGMMDGTAKEEIPNSIYNEKAEIVVVTSSTDTYRYVVVGKEQGHYGLEVISIRSGKAMDFAAADTPTNVGTTHQYSIDWDSLAEGRDGTLLEVDTEGDGDFEESLSLGDKFDGSLVSPANLTNLKRGSLLWLWIVLIALALVSILIVAGYRAGFLNLKR